jgi:hypothetical protein
MNGIGIRKKFTTERNVKMKKTNSAILLAVMLATACFAGAVKKDDIPVSSKWVAHLDFDGFVQTDLWSILKEDITSEQQRQIDAVADIIGFDPINDLHSLTVYGKNNDDNDAVVVVRCNADKDKIITLLKLSEDYSEEEAAGTTLYHWTDKKDNKKKVGAFAADNKIVISGSRARVTEYLDMKSDTIAKANDSSIAKLIDSAGNPVLLVAAADLEELAEEKTKDDVLLRNSSFLAILTGETDGNMYFNVELTAQTEETATQFEQMYQGFKALVSLQHREDPDAMSFINSAVLKKDANKLSFSIKYPSAKIAALIKENEHKIRTDALKELNESAE